MKPYVVGSLVMAMLAGCAGTMDARRAGGFVGEEDGA